MSTSQDFNEGFRVLFRNYVIAGATVSSLISSRFWGAQLATLDLSSSSFPLAVFFPTTGNHTNLSIIKKFFLTVRCYSNTSFDEAYNVHEAITERLGGTNGPITIPSSKIIVRPSTLPTETYEEEARIYGVGSRFLVHWIT